MRSDSHEMNGSIESTVSRPRRPSARAAEKGGDLRKFCRNTQRADLTNASAPFVREDVQAPAGTGGSRRSDKRKALEARAECRDAKERVAVQRQRSQNLKARDGKNCDFLNLEFKKANFTTPADIFGPTCDLERIYFFYVIFSSSGAPSRYIRVSKDRLG